MSLVDVVDEVLDQLEADEQLQFMLDGQLATVDDYLEIRPENEERIRALVQAGRLAIGPWQTLVDEFLVDGETTLRNLETGLARAAEFGGAMRVGYLPDMFGHVAQMPQILRLAGLETAVVWRGVPTAVDFHRFVWEGEDGSSVVAEYLPEGYGNAARLFDEPGEPPIEEFEERMRPWFGDDEILGMVGTDHMPLVPDLSRRLPQGSRIGTLGEYLARCSPDGLKTWRGEMRSAARANLLPGVVSARIDLKAACSRAERWLERYAEPLQTLYGARIVVGARSCARPGRECSRTPRTTRSAAARPTRCPHRCSCATRRRSRSAASSPSVRSTGLPRSVRRSRSRW